VWGWQLLAWWLAGLAIQAIVGAAAIYVLARVLRTLANRWLERRSLDPEISRLLSRSIFVGLIGLGACALVAVLVSSVATRALQGIVVVALTHYAAQAIAGGILLGALYVLARVLSKLAHRWMARRSLDPEVSLLVSRSIYLGLVAVGVFALVAALLASVATALWGVIVAALIASLGIQDVFRNYVSGFYILLERNIRVGDRVETNGYQGVVTDVRMRVTYLRGDDGQLVIVPNSELFSKAAVVWAPKGEPSAAERPSGGEGAQDHPT
jgi:small-conductance mechanosensitive channel